MSNLNTGVLVGGVAILCLMSGLQYSQMKQLEERITQIESRSSAAVTSVVRNDGKSSSSMRRGASNGAPNAAMGGATPNAQQKVQREGAANEPFEPIVVGSEEDLEKLIMSTSERQREERYQRWQEIGEEHLKVTIKEFSDEQGIDDSQSEALVSMIQGWHEDRRYLREGVMDGSLSVLEMREEMKASREQLNEDVDALLGEEMAAALWERMPQRRGPF